MKRVPLSPKGLDRSTRKAVITATEIKLQRAKNLLQVTFSDGTEVSLPAEYLRVESPSAEVQGHHPSQRQWLGGKRHVAITGIEPTGNYAVRLTFSDGHDTGIFSWDTLHQLGREFAVRWPAYLEALDAAGLSRD
jgi:DUF971 family protein